MKNFLTSERNYYQKDREISWSIKDPKGFLKFWKIKDEIITVNGTDTAISKVYKFLVKNKDCTFNTFIETKNKYRLGFFHTTFTNDFSIGSVEKL